MVRALYAVFAWAQSPSERDSRLGVVMLPQKWSCETRDQNNRVGCVTDNPKVIVELEFGHVVSVTPCVTCKECNFGHVVSEIPSGTSK